MLWQIYISTPSKTERYVMKGSEKLLKLFYIQQKTGSEENIKVEQY